MVVNGSAAKMKKMKMAYNSMFWEPVNHENIKLITAFVCCLITTRTKMVGRMSNPERSIQLSKHAGSDSTAHLHVRLPQELLSELFP